VAYSFEDFARDGNVSRETLADYQCWHELLVKWNKRINLVSPSALDDFWRRHALDSQQLWPFVPENAQKFIDLGSGAGFPGLAMAIGCKARGQGRVVLVESAGKKASFLKTVIRELELPAEAISKRAESLPAEPYDVITARAFAPLPRLLAYALPFWGEASVGLFLKGEAVDEELTQAQKTWTFAVESFPSRTNVTGQILKITGLRPR